MANSAKPVRSTYTFTANDIDSHTTAGSDISLAKETTGRAHALPIALYIGSTGTYNLELMNGETPSPYLIAGTYLMVGTVLKVKSTTTSGYKFSALYH